MLLLGLGVLTPAAAFARWAMAERSLRHDGPLPPLGVLAVVITGVVLLTAAVLAVIGIFCIRDPCERVRQRLPPRGAARAHSAVLAAHRSGQRDRGDRHRPALLGHPRRRDTAGAAGDDRPGRHRFRPRSTPLRPDP